MGVVTPYLTEYQVSASGQSGDYLWLNFFSLKGTFVGGQVVFENDSNGSDSTGGAVALDPAFLETPEPATLITMLGGAGLLALAKKQRRA